MRCMLSGYMPALNYSLSIGYLRNMVANRLCSSDKKKNKKKKNMIK